MIRALMRFGPGGRTALYTAGFVAAVTLDPETPLGAADWLLELVLVWVAATWGGPREMLIACGVATLTIGAGLWTSTPGKVPFWLDALNRTVVVIVMWTIIHVARARRLAETERAKAAAEIKVLEGLLPICAGCKAIRADTGDWHSLESYITDHSAAVFSHTYCPACREKYFPDLGIAGEPAATRARHA